MAPHGNWLRPIRRSRLRAAAVSGSLLLVVGLAGCTSSGDSGNGVSEIKVGLIFPTTGGMSALGTDQSKAAKMVLEWANDHGGVGGAKFKIVEGDSQSTPGTGATVAQRMIDQDARWST
jgi:branched-chain amino acid transport system substrate-binding protein